MFEPAKRWANGYLLEYKTFPIVLRIQSTFGKCFLSHGDLRFKITLKFEMTRMKKQIFLLIIVLFAVLPLGAQ